MPNRPTVIALFGRPGSGKSTLVQRFRKRHPSFRHYDVYTFVRPFVRQDGSLDAVHLRRAYRQIARRASSVRHDAIFEFGVSYPELAVPPVARCAHFANVRVFALLRNTKECFRFKRRQCAYDARQLRERMRRPFPREHQRLVLRHRLPFRKLELWRGYPSVIRSIEQMLDDA